MLFSDGHIYLYSLGEDDGFAEPIAHDGLTYYAAPFASRNSKWTVVTVFYDQENCRFLEVQYQIFEVAEIVDSPTAKFSLNNMNADMVFMQDGFQKYYMKSCRRTAHQNQPPKAHPSEAEQSTAARSRYQTPPSPCIPEAP